jgi:hypothetical protein
VIKKITINTTKQAAASAASEKALKPYAQYWPVVIGVPLLFEYDDGLASAAASRFKMR